MRAICFTNSDESGKRGARFLVFVLLSLFFAACGSSGAPAAGEAVTPTLAPVYVRRTPPATAEPNADANALPTRARMYIPAQGTSTPPPANDPNGVPTPAHIFISQSTRNAPDNSADPNVLPTLAPIFKASAIPTPALVVGLAPMATSAPRTAAPEDSGGETGTPEPGLAVKPASIVEALIFDDALDANWSLDKSQGVTLDPNATANAHDGKAAVKATFNQDFGRVFFTVKSSATKAYERAKTWGATLWLYTGENDYGPEDLTVTIVGSNAQAYYMPNDTSVVIDDKRFFSETRLFYLGITRQMPRNTWVELTVELDNLPYDPDYKYITGLYVKNDKEIRGTVYIDRAALLMVE